jgi:hypothetical protein
VRMFDGFEEVINGGRRGVEAFPFTEAEWAAVNDAVLPVVNATLTDDTAVRASPLVRLGICLERVPMCDPQIRPAPFSTG